MIEVFADVLCPFTHVGLLRLVAHRRAIGANTVIRVRAWPLELVNGKPLSAAFVAEEVAEMRAQVAPDMFAGFSEAHFPSTSLPALDVAAAAYRRSTPAGEQVSLALRHAVFEEGRDISSPDVLADIARSHDLRPTGPGDRETVLADWEEGRERGVLGSPHFFLDGDDFFCPALEITRIEHHLQIRHDDAGFQRFLAHAFPETAVGT
jgi:predicted DsbA family dithiol-disulfide isomerase